MIQERLNLLKQSSDDEILNNTEQIIQQERRLTSELLQHLREIDRRMLYAKMGYASLYDFLVYRFNYSSGAAYRRIATMRLIRDVPEVEQKVTAGSLSLSSAARVQTFFRGVKLEKSISLTPSEKNEIIMQVENKSARDVEKILMHISPSAIPKDKQRQITDELTEIKFIANESLKAKLDQIKQLISNKLPFAGYREVINEASDIAIGHLCRRQAPSASARAGLALSAREAEQRLPAREVALALPAREAVADLSRTSPLVDTEQSSESLVHGGELLISGSESLRSGSESLRSKNKLLRRPSDGDNQGELFSYEKSNNLRYAKPTSRSARVNGLVAKTLNKKSENAIQEGASVIPPKQNLRPYISVTLKAQVWKRCEASCVFQSSNSENRCGSRYRLEVDHIVPVALGGKTELNNLRLLCQTHNLFEARRVFGIHHMAKHVNKFL